MTEQPEAVVSTPKHRFKIPLPTKTHVRKAAVIATAAGLGAVIGARRVKNACACESDTPETPNTSDNN